jgi:hypothetical protein
MAYKLSLMVINIEDIIKMENLMEKGSISGKMALLIMDIFNKE